MEMPAEKRRATVIAMDEVLGLDLANWAPMEETVPEEIERMLKERTAARISRDWTRADELRDLIQAAGFDIEDGAGGSRVRRR